MQRTRALSRGLRLSLTTAASHPTPQLRRATPPSSSPLRTCCLSPLPAPPAAPLPLLHARRWGSAAAAAADTMDEGDYDDMDAYELFILATEEGVGETDTAPSTEEPLLSSSSASLVAEALSLLPPDGAALRLTEVTPLLDAEAVCEAFGSLLKMLQRHPQHFACEQRADAAGGDGPLRWYVRRRDAAESAAAAAEAHHLTAADMTDVHMAEELQRVGLAGRSHQQQRQRPKQKPPSPHRVAPRCSGPPITTAAAAPVDWAALAAVLPSEGAVAVADVRATGRLPAAVAERMAAEGKGLLRLLREQHTAAAPHVESTMDGAAIARAGRLAAAGQAAWSPAAAAAAAAARPAVEGDDNDEWGMDLDLDGNGAGPGDAADAEDEPLGGPPDAAAEGEEAPEVYYSGPAVVVPAFFVPGRSAPAKRPPPPAAAAPRPPKGSGPPRPTPPTTAATGKGKGKGKVPAPLQSKPQPQPQPQQPKQRPPPPTPEELLSAHTALAELRGWRTPAQMLDLLVECVPTFFVPASELVASDSLAKVIGPRNTLARLVRVYSYYFERDAPTGRVRLRPGLTHPAVGSADAHYRALAPPTLAEGEEAAAAGGVKGGRGQLRPSAATGVFPVLRPIIRSAVDVGAGGMRAPRGARVPPAAAAAATTTTLRTGAHPKANPFALAASLSTEEVPRAPLSPLERLFFALLLRLPHDEAVSLSTAAEWVQGVTAAEVFAALGQDAAALTPDGTQFQRWVRLYEPFLFDPSAGSVRLRPFWVAPGSTGDGGPSAALPAGVTRQLRPLWRPIDGLCAASGRLTDDEWAALAALAGIAAAARGTEAAATAVAVLLRGCGRVAWVSGDGRQVRRYAASADMDDLTHAAVALVAAVASPTTLEPLDAVVARADAAMAAAAGGDAEAPAVTSGGVSRMLRAAPAGDVLRFLSAHAKQLEVAASPEGATVLRRRTHFGAFTSK